MPTLLFDKVPIILSLNIKHAAVDAFFAKKRFVDSIKSGHHLKLLAAYAMMQISDTRSWGNRKRAEGESVYMAIKLTSKTLIVGKNPFLFLKNHSMSKSFQALSIVLVCNE